jgi:hypothetical protein
MLRILTGAALLITMAGTFSASALPACWKCCPGSGHTSDGHCVSYCSGDCNGRLPMRLMLSTSQCADEYRELICDGPRCKLVCVGAKR